MFKSNRNARKQDQLRKGSIKLFDRVWSTTFLLGHPHHLWVWMGLTNQIASYTLNKARVQVLWKLVSVLLVSNSEIKNWSVTPKTKDVILQRTSGVLDLLQINTTQWRVWLKRRRKCIHALYWPSGFLVCLSWKWTLMIVVLLEMVEYFLILVFALPNHISNMDIVLHASSQLCSWCEGYFLDMCAENVTKKGCHFNITLQHPPSVI